MNSFVVVALFFLARVVLFVGAVAVSSGLQCYVCSTADDSTCDDLYGKPAGHLQDCLSDDGCSKTKSTGKVFGIKASTSKFLK
ncbi:hypothetical protein EB796_008191 [Bugula neritina]|uniref:Uncharacterized protein n=1 Tax=Bugula neritina TaxID=10212 RepID=A0A7J7K4D6_BUGNE|nr:hypothetical protein EB796_008191 [Bugula neritina]